MKLPKIHTGPPPKLTYFLISICTGIFVVEVLFNALYGEELLTAMLSSFGFSLANLLGGGWWTFITSIFFHASAEHLIFNMIALFFFGRVLEEHLGWKKMLLIFFASGFVGNIAILFGTAVGWVSPIIPTIGASAAIFGLMGVAMLVKPLEFIFYPYLIPIPLILVAILYTLYNIVDFVILLVTGAESQISYISHIGGLVFGMFFGFREEGRRRGLLVLVLIIAILITIPFVWFLLSYLELTNYVTLISQIGS